MLHEDRYGILKSYSTIARAKGSTDRGSKGGRKQHTFMLNVQRWFFTISHIINST